MTPSSLSSSSSSSSSPQVQRQPMSASDARELHGAIREAEARLEKNREMEQSNHARIAELQMQHNRWAEP